VGTIDYPDMGTVTRGGSMHVILGVAIASTCSENLHLTNLF